MPATRADAHAVDASAVSDQLRSAGPGAPMPSGLLKRVEARTGTDLSAARLHDDPASRRMNGALGTAAFTRGNDVFVRRGASDAVLEHELHHVAAGDGRASGQVAAAVIDDERVKVNAEREYRQAAETLELKLGPHLSKTDEVNQIADEMLARLKRIVDAWAKATNTGKEKAYESEFAFPTGRKYYGSFQLTAKEIKRVFEKPQPLRKKLNLVYYAVRNGNLAKYLDAAANEIFLLDQGKSGTQTSTVIENDQHKSRTIKKGFAEQSGLKKRWEDNDASPVGPTSKDEVQNDLRSRQQRAAGDGKQAALGGWTGALSMGDSNKELKGDKIYDTYAGVDLAETNTLKRGDVDDITTAEMRLLYERQGKRQPLWISGKDKENFKKKDAKQVMWEQGGENIEVASNSKTREIAEQTMSRLEGGISGSTDLMMHASKHLGFTDVNDLKKLRLALVAWMLSNRDHSFFEIMKVANDYGATFHLDDKNPGAEYEAVDNFYPLPKAKVEAFADLMPNKKLPRYYLSDTNKGDVKANDVEQGTSMTHYVDDLVQAGLTLDDTWKTEAKARDLSQWLALRAQVRKLALLAGKSEDALRANRLKVQKLLKDPAWHHLIKPGVDPNVRANLRALILREKGAAAVVSDHDLTVTAGVPASMVADIDEYKRYDVYRLFVAVQGKAPSLKSKSSSAHQEGVAELRSSLPYQAVKAWFNVVNAQLMLSKMLNQVLGDARSTESEKDQAQQLPRYAAYRVRFPKLPASTTHIKSLGIPASWLSFISRQFSVDPLYVHFTIDELATKVKGVGFVRDQAPTSKSNQTARSTLKATAEYKLVSNSLRDYMDELTAYLLEKELGGTGVTEGESDKAFEGKLQTEKLDELTALGVPREIAEQSPKEALTALHKLHRRVLAATFDIKLAANAPVNVKAWSDLTSSAEVKTLQKTTGYRNFAVPLAAVMVRDLVAATVLAKDALLLARGTDQRISEADKERLGKSHVIDTNALETPTMSGEAPATGKSQQDQREERYWATEASQREFTANVGGKSPTVRAKLGAFRASLQDKAERDKLIMEIATELAAAQTGKEEDKLKPKQIAKLHFGDGSVEDQIETIFALMGPDKMIARLDPDTKAAIDAIAQLDPRERGALYQYTNKLHEELGWTTDTFPLNNDFTAQDLNKVTDKVRSLKFMLPMIEALHSALEKLPVYKGPILFSGRKSGASLTQKTDEERMAYAKRHYAVGSVIGYGYPLSTAKDLASSFVPSAATYDICLQIEGPFKTGADIEYLSNKPNEKEVLFPQGVRFKVIRVEPQVAGPLNDSIRNKLNVVIKEI